MSIEKVNLDAIEEGDLLELVDAQVPEGLRIEYKVEIYGKLESDRKELAKDVSAFANSHGGHLVIGVEETEGVATKICGVSVDFDAEILRMENILRSSIEPPITGIRMRYIPLISGRKVLLLRIPRSWNPPHRVTAQGTNKFFMRHSAGVHEPSIEELRALFSESATILEKARKFRTDRIQLVSNGEGFRPLINSGRMFIHIVPFAAFSGMVNLDIEQVYKMNDAFRPLGADSMSPGCNFYGFINERGGEKNPGYTQVFRNGILEATKAKIARDVEGSKLIYGLELEGTILKYLSIYINGLKQIGVPSPLILMLALEGVKGAQYAAIQDHLGNYPPPLAENILLLPECILQDYGTDLEYHNAVRPAFNTLWNANGYFKDPFFNDNGLWVGNKKK